MTKNILACLVAVGFLVACSSGGGGGGSGGGAEEIFASDIQLTVEQNNRVTVDLSLQEDVAFEVAQLPAHGIVKLDGSRITYRVTDPQYSGTDVFTYQLREGTTVSNEATIQVTINSVPTGTFTFTENYASGAYALTGWQQHSSTFGHTSNSEVSFENTTFNGAASTSRRFAIYGDVTSYAGDAFYNSLFAGLPVDGAGGGMYDWPWKAELLHENQCGAENVITAKVIRRNGKNPMGAILLNYDIETDSAGDQKVTGYQLLFNAGGGSLTLSRFDYVDEYATAYLDRWPNTNYGNEAMTNPVVSGPYKGWNYRRGVWPAGGNVGANAGFIVAVKYEHDSGTDTTVISYEARPPNGNDLTPGSWDEVVTLTGADSLPSGGSFGVMGVNYHTTSLLLDTDFDITEFKMVCDL